MKYHTYLSLATFNLIISFFLIFFGILIYIFPMEIASILFVLIYWSPPLEVISLIGLIAAITGVIIFALGIPLMIIGIKVKGEQKVLEREEKKKQDYKDLSWLKYQYYDLGKSIQDIADDQNVSIIEINKWLDKTKP